MHEVEALLWLFGTEQQFLEIIMGFTILIKEDAELTDAFG